MAIELQVNVTVPADAGLKISVSFKPTLMLPLIACQGVAVIPQLSLPWVTLKESIFTALPPDAEADPPGTLYSKFAYAPAAFLLENDGVPPKIL